jgi:hypothetical protein
MGISLDIILLLLNTITVNKANLTRKLHAKKIV